MLDIEAIIKICEQRERYRHLSVLGKDGYEASVAFAEACEALPDLARRMLRLQTLLAQIIPVAHNDWPELSDLLGIEQPQSER